MAMSHEKSTKRPKLAREGFVGRLRYFLERALVNLRQNLLINLLTVGTISLAFLILSLFLLVYVNLERITDTWSERVQVSAYLDREFSKNEAEALVSKVRAIGGTANVAYVSKKEALKRFSSRLKGQEALLDGVSPDLLPSSLEIRLARAYRDSDSLVSFVSRLKKIPGVIEVQYGEEWVKRFTEFMNLIRFAGALVGGFIVFAVVFIVANTIKLTIYSRKDELELMGLVGAARWFIKMPFLIEGVIQGIAGACIAILVLCGVYLAFLHNSDIFFSFTPMDTTLLFLPFTHIAAIIVSGAMLGFLGSLASLKRFITL
jgi:cell division transport system permease protein